MQLSLTPEQIAGARNNNLGDITAVLAAMDHRVQWHANHYASTGGRLDRDLAEDLAQDGRMALWRAIERFEGDEVSQFFAFADRTISGALADKRREMTRQGASRQASKDFETALGMCGGDPYEAERFCIDPPTGFRRLSPESAWAARMAWQGLRYLDAPAGVDGTTLGDVVADTTDVPADLVEQADVERHRRHVIRDAVHTTLNKMGPMQGHVLRADFGIAPVPLYGPEVPDEDLAADMGVTERQVRQGRYLGRKRFAELYLAGATEAA
ncbi:sigma-70 family RNA polymerase sigma factor [Kitasatospora sp. NPDC088779]|uniref:sigma-70 family RNA polymerase sigma factor n=1 Tax=Kitasatospora sp. NPDC088779 TaxID=3154964 RepID=UPI00341D8A6A